jgi:hsp70-interacting protein
VSFLVPSGSSTLQSRSKAIYTLSGLLKHNAPAVKELSNSDVEGWTKLRDSLQGMILLTYPILTHPNILLADPEITVRRKTLFLLNTLLIPTMSSSSGAPSHLHTPDSHTDEEQQHPIHANSHAVHLHNPSRASTSQLTLDAFREHGITDAVVDVLTNPLPCGEDGEEEGGDMEVEENGVRLVLFSVCVI